ncbi:mRNA decay activator protein ZFP36L2-like [Mytilus californianus]|uniref:mRNA decay activator protein ZFP36L2-like n=1 Tax=Mytilus californianus TaxID=6549 RepID=UPI0022453B0D|nr:mRNA decay activator protein ZFP36L2-like [Mytilus californianus]
MSSAQISAFYDVGDVLQQNRRNQQMKQFNERRATIGAMMSRNGNMSSSSFITITQQNGVTDLNQNENLHRKLDRSISEPIGDRALSSLSIQRNNVNSSRYKTELCRPFEESGHCKYGDKCQFAHGGHELRTLNRHPKYKTELCRTFHTIGFCPYGPRCHFVHNEDDQKLAEMVKNHEAMLAQRRQPSSPPPSTNNSARRPSNISFAGSDYSPPSSDSPSLSPASSDDFSRLSSCSSSMSGNSSTSSSPVFNYSADLQTIASLLQPLNVQTQMNNVNNSSIDSLSQQLNAILNLSYQQRNMNNNHNVFGDSWDVTPAPPSPPDSISGDSVGSASSLSSSGSFSSSHNTYGSPLDISKQLQIRLPIFNTLSQDD